MTPTTPFFHTRRNPGALRISGPDRIEFIQRQSTNDLLLLKPGMFVSTVLTNPAARIIDVLQVFQESADSLLAITLPGRGPDTLNFLKRRVFFNDQVGIEDQSRNFHILDVEGPGAGKVLANLGLPMPAAGRTEVANFEGAALRLAGRDGPGGQGVRLILPFDRGNALKAALAQAGAEELSEKAYEVLRIEAGLPGPGAELTENYTPLETGLDDLVSSTKGCYTGQEIIARQITYDKITRILVGLHLERAGEAGSRILVNGSAVGKLTSCTQSPRLGAIGLGIVRRPYFETGTRVEVEVNGRTVPAIVKSLPF